MNALPNTPHPGSPPAPAVWFRQCVDYLRALSARLAAVEARIQRSTAAQASASASASTPWQISGVVVSSEARIYVVPGKANQVVPTIGGTSLVAYPSPYIVVTGASGQIWARATVDDDGVITNLILTNETSAQVDVPASGYYFLLVGTWTSASGAFTSTISLLDGNATFLLCNGAASWGPAA